jgi:hypothetical protein
MNLKNEVNGLYALARSRQCSAAQPGRQTLPARALLTSTLMFALSVTLSGCADGSAWAAQPSEPPASTEDEFPGGDVSEAPASTATPESSATEQVAREPAPPTSDTSEAAPRPMLLPTASPADPGSTSDGASEPTAPDAPAAPAPTMRTSGRRILDSCGNTFVTRGVEQIFGEQLPQGNDWVGLAEQIASSGVNAVRVLAGTDALDVDDVDAVLSVVRDQGMVGYVTPYGDDGRNWLEAREVRDMLAKHERYIIIDAFGEPTFDDRDRFVSEATEAIRQVRSWGYRVPLTATANQFGRDLPSLLTLGDEIVASDPLDNTIMGWQAYWGSGGFYQDTYGMSLTEGVAAAARAPFPIQLGLDRITDFPSPETADYGALLSATEEHGIGWLWWDWFNPYGNENNLTENGEASRLTPTGQTVVNTHAASVQKTARLACATSAPSGG